MKNITILGATGSIGKSTFAVIARHPQKFRVFAVGANQNWRSLVEICQAFKPRYAVMKNPDAAEKLAQSLKNDTEVLCGDEALVKIAEHPKTDYVMAAIIGAAGMRPTLAAAAAGKRVMLANKEALILAGELLMQTAAEQNAELIPVDSEHSAIFQVLQGGRQGLHKIQLTASGGPFLHTPAEKLKTITPDEACAHPNWSMGRKISVDSATMMNKGLEMIEAHYLFDLPENAIDIVIHPPSIVHSSVYFIDGSVISQLGVPNMQTAIAYALAFPKRIETEVETLNLSKVSPLEFFPPDHRKFPCLELARSALKKGAPSMIALNAANEVAVAAFLNGEIGFLKIPEIIEKTLSEQNFQNHQTLDEIIRSDQNAREITKILVGKIRK